MHRVAAIQMRGRLGDIAYNLKHIEELIDIAAARGAEVISLPEFFTTTVVLDDSVCSCALPPANSALDLLIKSAKKYNVLIGGSYLEKRGNDIFNCYTLVQPDGSVTRHDKDLPTMIENAFYTGGKTKGIHKTNIGRVGTAVCWETIRTQTVDRLYGNIDFLMTGSHWWTAASNWYIGKRFFKRMDEMNRKLMRSAPQAFASQLGVANIHAGHCGEINGQFPALPKQLLNIPFKSVLLGETQIVDNKGIVVARLTQEDGPGVIVADIELVSANPIRLKSTGFWIPSLPKRFHIVWWHQNWIAKGLYKDAKRNGRI